MLPERGTGLAILIGAGARTTLRFCRSSRRSCRRSGGSRSRARVLGSRKIAGCLVFVDVENDDFVRSHPRHALHIELHRLARSFVLLLYGPVVDEDGHRVLGFLGVRPIERELNRTNLLPILGLCECEFVIIAIAAALELLEIVMVACDEAAHHPHVARGAFKLALGGFEIT